MTTFSVLNCSALPERICTVTMPLLAGRTWPQTVALFDPFGRSTQNGFGKLFPDGLITPLSVYIPDCQAQLLACV